MHHIFKQTLVFQVFDLHSRDGFLSNCFNSFTKFPTSFGVVIAKTQLNLLIQYFEC